MSNTNNPINEEQRLQQKLSSLVDTPYNGYSRHWDERINSIINDCTSILKKTPQSLTHGVLTAYLKGIKSPSSNIKSFTERLVNFYAEHNADNLAQEYNNLMPSLIDGNHQKIILNIFKNMPTITADLKKWVKIAATYEESSIGSALCDFRPDAICFDLHIQAYKGHSKTHADYLENEARKRYPDATALQEAISEQGNNAYKKLLQNIQYRENIGDGWQYSRENDDEISFSTSMQHIKLTRVFNFKSQQVTQITETSEKFCTDIQNFSDIEHDAEIRQARAYLNLIHGKTEDAPNTKSKLKLSIKQP